jgi:hypothetical protein
MHLHHGIRYQEQAKKIHLRPNKERELFNCTWQPGSLKTTVRGTHLIRDVAQLPVEGTGVGDGDGIAGPVIGILSSAADR